VKKREIWACFDPALDLLPAHVRQYVIKNTLFAIDKIGHSDSPDYESTDWSHASDAGWTIENDVNYIVLDPRIPTKRTATRAMLHEIAHAWLNHRGKKNTEKMAILLSKYWLKRGVNKC
jgi:hypothetical protein